MSKLPATFLFLFSRPQIHVRGTPAPLGFYHSIELPDGRVLEGILKIDTLKERLKAMSIPADLRGKRALDIGTWDGWFGFEMERRGAEVMASRQDDSKIRKFPRHSRAV